MKTRGHPSSGGFHRKVLGLVVVVSLLLVALELGAYLLSARSADPGLRRVVRDFPMLSHRLARGFRFVPDNALAYRLKPGFTLSKDGETTRHNAQGFRASKPFGAKAPDKVRALCIGGSTTYGAGVVDNKATYPAALERALHASGLENAEVLNLGVGGYTTIEVLANYRLYGAPLEPDIVIVQCAINDVPPRFYPGFKCSYDHFRRKLTIPRSDGLALVAYRSRLFLLLAYESGWLSPLTLQDRTQPPWPEVEEMHRNLSASGTECFRQHVNDIILAIRGDGAVPVLLTQSYLEHPDFEIPGPENLRFEEAFQIGLRQHTVVVRDLSEEKGVRLVDLSEEFPLRRRYFSDPIHLTATGNAAKGRLVADAVLPLLQGR